MAYTGTTFDATGATLTLGGTELAAGGTTDVSCTEKFEENETLAFGNYPDPIRTTKRSWVEGSVNFIMDADSDFPNAGNAAVAMIVTSDGLYFNGSVNITDITVKVDVNTGISTGSFNFRTVTQTYTLSNAA